jgi:hypothetical protein
VTAPANLPANLKGDNQIGDNEGNGFMTGYRLNGDLVQGYWSKKYQGFIVPDGNKQAFTMTPVWNGSNFTYTWDLTVQGDQLGVNDNIRLDAAPNKSSVVTMNNETATFEAGTVRNINVDTGGGVNNVQVANVLAGVTVNIDSSGKSTDSVLIGSDSESLAGIQGTVNVSNTSGQTSLEIDGFADGARTVDITDHSVDFSGLAHVNYKGGNKWKDGTLHGVTSLDVVDGKGANQVEVDSVPALTSVTLWGDTQDVIFGAAAALINVHKTHT